jgi:glycosyltransferase Alg8
MRNNGRALALGYRKTGLFIWICILDQRISMWTSLVGITGASILAIFKNFIYLPVFIAWILIVRSIQMTVIALNGHPVSITTIPIMLYNQWVGSIIKIRAFFHLSDQKWSKGGKKQDATGDNIPVPHILARFMPRFLMTMSYAAFLFILLITEQVLSLPNMHVLQAAQNNESGLPIVFAKDHGVIANDGQDDSEALNTLIAKANKNAVIQLPPGKIDLEHSLIIARSNITLQGSGREGTTIYSTIKTPAQAVIVIGGKFGKKLGRISADAIIGNSVIEFNNSNSALQHDDIILLRQENDQEFFDSIGSVRWRKKSPIIRQSMFQVLDYDNSGLLYLDRSLDIDFSNQKTMIIKPDMVKNVIIRDLTVLQTVPGQNIEDVKHVYENVFPEYWVDLVRFIWTSHSEVRNVNLLQAGRHALVFENSFGNIAEELHVSGAWNKGKKGTGYIRFARAFKCQFRDSSVKDIRHITLQWSSAYNLFENIRSWVDFNVHGGYPHHNYISNITFTIPPEHKWKPITLAPADAGWAPPNGPENQFNQIQIQQ